MLLIIIPTFSPFVWAVGSVLHRSIGKIATKPGMYKARLKQYTRSTKIRGKTRTDFKAMKKTVQDRLYLEKRLTSEGRDGVRDATGPLKESETRAQLADY